MGFLRRILGGGQQEPATDSQWYDLPDDGYFLIAGAEHHRDNVARTIPLTVEEAVHDDVPVTLHRDPRNQYDPNAVEVRLNDRLIGNIPRDNAANWSAFLTRLEAAGYRARSTARIRAVDNRYWINLRADPDADFLMPEEQAARAAAAAQAEAERLARKEAEAKERAEKAAAREQARADRDQAQAIERERREAQPCRDCGQPVGPSTGPGRPSVYCADCRARRAG